MPSGNVLVNKKKLEESLLFNINDKKYKSSVQINHKN